MNDITQKKETMNVVWWENLEVTKFEVSGVHNFIPFEKQKFDIAQHFNTKKIVWTLFHKETR